MSSGRAEGGRPLSFRARLAVAAYVLLTWPVMTAFLFGPLAALVAASRPKTRRAWLWFGALALWMLLWAAEAGGLLDQFIRATAVLSTGLGVLALTLSRGSVSTRAIRGTALAAAGTGTLTLALGLRWRDIEIAIVQQGQLAQRVAADLLSRGGKAPDPATLEALRTLGEGLRPMAPFFPGVIALLVFVGLCLAALLAPRIAGRAVAPAAGGFNSFRFNDHLIWGVILGLGGVLFAQGTGLDGPASSLLAFTVGLYALRGAAIMATALRLAPRMLVTLLAIGALFLLPFAVGGLTLLGVSDTWLDFRRRMAPPPGGQNP